jgi:hypothetical protein
MTVGGMPRGLERQSLTMAPSASGGCRVISLRKRCARSWLNVSAGKHGDVAQLVEHLFCN